MYIFDFFLIQTQQVDMMFSSALTSYDVFTGQKYVFQGLLLLVDTELKQQSRSLLLFEQHVMMYKLTIN